MEKKIYSKEESLQPEIKKEWFLRIWFATDLVFEFPINEGDLVKGHAAFIKDFIGWNLRSSDNGFLELPSGEVVNLRQASHFTVMCRTY